MHLLVCDMLIYKKPRNQAYRSIVGVSTLQFSLLSCCWQILADSGKEAQLLAIACQIHTARSLFLPILAVSCKRLMIHADLR